MSRSSPGRCDSRGHGSSLGSWPPSVSFGSPFRYLVRISDGSLAGNLNVQGTFCEIEKAIHLLGLPTGLVEGERAWLNHVVHAVGVVVAYGLSRCSAAPL